MVRDDKIDALANHLTVTHQDNVRLEALLERLIKEIREGSKETYEIRMSLSSFEAEARLLINDRINEMSVERLAELLTRDKIDKVRALLFAREKGLAESPLAREPTGSIAVARPEPEKHASTAGHVKEALVVFKDMPLLSRLILLMVLLAAAAVAYYVNDALHTPKQPRPGQTHSELK